MRELNIGTKLCTTVYAGDNPEFGTSHIYHIKLTEEDKIVETIKFQKGPVKEHGRNGIHNEDLIAIVIDRLQGFQGTEFTCEENAMAIHKFVEGLMWLNKRTQGRLNRGVEGTHEV